MKPHHEPHDSFKDSRNSIDPDKTKLVISSVVRAVVWSCGLIVFGYTMALAIGDFKTAQAESFLRVDSKMLQLQTKVDKLHDDMAVIASNSWTISDMERYMNQHRWENRALNLSVEDPRKTKTP